MLGTNLKKHINEFRRYITNHQYERTETGIYCPAAHVGIGGVYVHNVNGEDEQSDKNTITDEGLEHMLAVVMLGTPVAVADWYVMIFSGTGTPATTTTAASFQNELTEIVATSGDPGGYAGAVRMTWTPDAIATGGVNSVTNAATPATFTVVSSGTLIVRGAALTSDQAKSAATGTLMSAGKFSAARNLVNADEFNLKYKVDFDN